MFLEGEFNLKILITHATVSTDTWQISQSETKKLGQGMAIDKSLTACNVFGVSSLAM